MDVEVEYLLCFPTFEACKFRLRDQGQSPRRHAASGSFRGFKFHERGRCLFMARSALLRAGTLARLSSFKPQPGSRHLSSPKLPLRVLLHQRGDGRLSSPRGSRAPAAGGLLHHNRL